MTWDKAIEIVGHKGYGYPENEIREAFGMAVEAMEYRELKTPIYKMAYSKRLLDEAWCPVCGETVYRDDDFCNKCGQALDWSKIEK